MSSSAPFVTLPTSVGELPTIVDRKEYGTKSEDSGMEVDHGSYRDRLLAEKRQVCRKDGSRSGGHQD
ncbi:hypothetical protein Sjap_003210 [Stephania japonica]|uniref:Uncharacterized protein n=1 Tax=Stephania japonica TaxID=461633 RepID=A0AAP0KQY8_9MAGN